MTVPSRVLRAAAVGLPTLQLALAAHLVGGGCVELLPGLLAGVLCLAGAWAVTGRQTTAAGLLVLVGSAQVAVHGLLACSGSAAELTTTALGAHALAAVTTALLLTRTDAALRGAARVRARLASYRLVLLVPATLPVPARPQPVPSAPRTLLHDAGVRAVPARRGPPVGSLRTA